MPKALDPLVKAGRDVEKYRLENINLRALNRKLMRRGSGYDDFILELREVLKEDTEFKFKQGPKLLAVPNDAAHEEIAAVAVSDLHLSETVRDEDANGVNRYNSIIAANRLWEHSQKVISILARHKTLYTLRKIWSPLLGDILNGSIHPELVITNDLSDPAAVLLGSRLLRMFYEELKRLDLPIEIDAVVGNHPRTTLKFPTKSVAYSNLDWLVYENLADRFKGDDQVNVKVHTSQIGHKQLFGWSYVFEHGVDVSNGKEEDLEDRIRALFDDPTYREATGYKGASFDQIVIGNMHKPKFLERTIVNGTYTGQNELGMSWRLKPIKAIQNMWGIAKKHVRTFQYGIDLTSMKSDKVLNAFSEYSSWYIKRHGR